MPTIKDNYLNALLADATYAFDRNIQNANGSDLITAVSQRMTPTLATQIAANFSLVTHIETDDITGSGFDGTVWRRTDGKLYVSMQGTEGLADFLSDVALSINGAATRQIIDMTNWWLRITTPTNTLARQFRTTGDSFVLTDAPKVAGTGFVTAADIAAGIQVNGHSLGGYLASAFTRLFGAQANVQHTTTFNSAGFAPGSEAVFQQLQSVIGPALGLGRFPSGAEQTNLFAKTGLNFTTNSFWFNQIGTRAQVFNEASIAQYPNHSIYKLTDSLALSAALERMDPSFSLTRATALFDAGSNNTSYSLEGILDGLSRLVLGLGVMPTQLGDADASATNRVSLHTNLQALLQAPAYQALADTVRVELSSQSLASQARENFSALASLLSLSPLWLNGNGTGDAALNALWSSPTWSVLRKQWSDDKALTPTQRDVGQENFTTTYLNDRASLLDALNRYNTLDSTGSIVTNRSASSVQTQYSDAATNTTLTVQNNGSQPRVYVKFGGTAADNLAGATLEDRLYGGAGSDTLTGQAGADYLEGGADADKLDGGGDADTLLGGTGADTLTGGSGGDLLLGGEGADVYTFATLSGTPSGHDVIEDSDGQGSITLNGTPVDGAGAVKVAEGAWVNKSSKISYTLTGEGPNATLTITQAGSKTDSIAIRQWSTTKNVGISLPSNVVAPPPAAQTLIGDFIKQFKADSPDLYKKEQINGVFNYVGGGLSQDALDVLNGSEVADWVAANQAVFAMAE
jgi:trimeric autotransporter adhesin